MYYPQVMLSENYSWEDQINDVITEQVLELFSLQTGDIPTTVEQMIGLMKSKIISEMY